VTITCVARLHLPDRPGVLGQVASRIGAVRGDVVGIDILERGEGRAVDELVITLPDDTLLELLVKELSQVDGVGVEDVRTVEGHRFDHQVNSLDLAAQIAEAHEGGQVLEALASETAGDLRADWAAVVNLDPAEVVAVVGEAPAVAWLIAFVEGSRHSEPSAAGEAGPDDLAWALLGATGLAFVLGRKGRPFRWRERRQIQSLARVAGAVLASSAG
jgi:hypothetical protein